MSSGAYSLAGEQTKYAARETPFIICGLMPERGCGAEKAGTAQRAETPTEKAEN